MFLANVANENSWQKSFIVTSLFCLFVSLLTLSVWGGPYYIHLFISLGFGYSALFFSWLIAHLFPEVPRRAEVLLSLTACLLFGILNARFWVSDYMGMSDMVPVGLMGLLFSGMCYFYFHSKEQQMRALHELEVIKREKAEQEQALLLSQLKQMQSQIEPHFLFNTLANISALMSQDIDKARLMLESLTAMMRATLSNCREEHTTIADEVALIEAYLAIQHIRLGDRLRYRIQVEPGLEHVSIPPLMLQPLVENAILHGIEPLKAGGEIEVTIDTFDQALQIRVKDTGAGLGSSSTHVGSGVGLNNLKQRVETLFAGRGQVSIVENKPQGVIVRLSWPLALTEKKE